MYSLSLQNFDYHVIYKKYKCMNDSSICLPHNDSSVFYECTRVLLRTRDTFHDKFTAGDLFMYNLLWNLVEL